MRAGPAEPNPFQFSTSLESKRHTEPFAKWVPPQSLTVTSREWGLGEPSTDVAKVARGALASLGRR